MSKKSISPPPSPLTFASSFSELQKSARFDARYFAPEYGRLVQQLKERCDAWDTVGNLVEFGGNFRPKEEQVYKYIEIANICRNGTVANCTHASGADLPSRARRRVATQDVLVSSLEGSLSSIALVDNEYDQALCSTGFHVVRSKRLLPEVLFILLRSEIGQKQLERGCNGGIMSSIRQEEFCKVHLPIPPEEVQQKIKETVSHSFMMIRQAGNLIGGSTNIMAGCSAEKNSWEACLTRLGDLK